MFEASALELSDGRGDEVWATRGDGQRWPRWQCRLCGHPGMHGCRAVPSCTLTPAQHWCCITTPAWATSLWGYVVTTAPEHTQDMGNPCQGLSLAKPHGFRGWQGSARTLPPLGAGPGAHVPRRGPAAGQVRAGLCKLRHHAGPGARDTAEAARGSSWRDKVKHAAQPGGCVCQLQASCPRPEGLPWLCPHHSAPGLCLFCLPLQHPGLCLHPQPGPGLGRTPKRVKTSQLLPPLPETLAAG